MPVWAETAGKPLGTQEFFVIMDAYVVPARIHEKAVHQ
jgi:hypothetical protein